MKRIFWVLVGVGLLFPNLLWAMALGDLKLESALDQPFKASIPIEEPGTLKSDDLSVSLSPTQINSAMSQDQQAILSDLHFQVVNENNGRIHIEIQSQQPINEPFLQLPIMLSWPSGELVREYTVMLNPVSTANTKSPVSTAVSTNTTHTPSANSPVSEQPVLKTTPSGQAPMQHTSEASPTGPTPIQHTSDVSPTGPTPMQNTSAASPKKAPRMLAKKIMYGPTREEDRLWQIASHYQPMSPHTSIQQWAFAIYSLNQEAFINGDINKLKSRVYLQIPSLQVVMAHSKEESSKWMNDQKQILAGG